MALFVPPNPDDDAEDADFAEPEPLRGQFLVAGRHLRDPNFYRTVVLLVEHGEDGAMGLVVNRPTDVEVRQALAGHFELPDATDPVYYGGPVEPSALFVLHDSVEFSGGELPLASGLFVGNSRDAFEGIVRSHEAGDEDLHFRVFAGCAGWGPGQLEDEMSRGDWVLTPPDDDPLLTLDPYEHWERLYRRLVRHPLFPDFDGDHRWN